VYAVGASSCLLLLLLLLQLGKCCQNCHHRFLNPYFFRS
jgi:hypothetical protein